MIYLLKLQTNNWHGLMQLEEVKVKNKILDIMKGD